MSARNNKIAVDPRGLKAIVRERGEVTLLDELVQNARDTNATEVTVEITSPANNRVRVVVTDNDPVGYADLKDAYTMFGESLKRDDASKAGFQNVGDKLCVAFAVEGRITSTSGSVIIEGETRRNGRNPTTVGTIADMTFPLSKAVMAEMLNRSYMMKPTQTLRVNGQIVPTSTPVATTSARLKLYVGEREDGLSIMRERVLKTDLEIHEAGAKGAWIYVLGIPVERVDLPWTVNVLGRLKSDMKRDAVPATEYRKIRVALADLMIDSLTKEDAEGWARVAIQDGKPETVRKLYELRHGTNTVMHNPSDPEASQKAIGNGMQVMYGNTGGYTGEERERINEVRRTFEDFTPSASKEFGSTGGPSVAPVYVSASQWTADVVALVAWTKAAMREVFGGEPLTVQILDNPDSTTLADYGDNEVRFNVGLLGWDWFRPGNFAEQFSLVSHEFGHHNHEEWDHTPKWANHALDIAGKLAVWSVKP